MANPQPQPDGASKLSLSPSERQMEVDQDWALEHYQQGQRALWVIWVDLRPA